MRIKIPNSKVKELLILENTLRFDDEEKYAKADHLTEEEVARCRTFGFVIDGVKEEQVIESTLSLDEMVTLQESTQESEQESESTLDEMVTLQKTISEKEPEPEQPKTLEAKKPPKSSASKKRTRKGVNK